MAQPPAPIALQLFVEAAPRVEPTPPDEPECECQDTERCPVHFGYD
jgi:hypothetical protein